MSKQVLYIFRGRLLKRILSQPKSNRSDDFLFGFNHLSHKFKKDYLIAPREKKKTLLEKMLYLFEKSFNLITKLGLPLEIYPLFKNKIKKADVIFCKNETIGFGILFYKMIGLVKTKTIVVVMSLPERLKYFKKNKLVIKFITKMLSYADYIYTLSYHAQKPLMLHFGVSKDKLEYLLCGTDTGFWKPNKKQNFILSVGNDFNRDFNTLTKAVPLNQKLIIVTRKKINKYNKKNIKVISDISDAKLRSLYQSAKITIIPSIKLEYESSGLSSALQAMACGSPVLISSSPALQELFKNNVDCLFFKAEDPKDLKNKILKLLNDKKLQSKLTDSGLKLVNQKYNTKNMANQIEKQINKFLN